MLLVLHPDNFLAERAYIHRVLLHDWLGLDFEAIPGQRDFTAIVENHAGSSSVVSIADCFFSKSLGHWLETTIPPGNNLDTWSLPNGCVTANGALPVLYGKRLQNDDYLHQSDGSISIGVDIFGSAFFMLTRYEECLPSQRDTFGRFPSQSSLVRRAGLLMRPIVNEYLELLWWALHRAFPHLVRREMSYRIVLSHDIDIPFLYAAKGVRQAARTLGGSIVHSKNLLEGLKQASSVAKILLGDYAADPFDTFDFLMDCADELGRPSTFNFVAGSSKTAYDPFYRIGSKPIRRLMRRVKQRGHALGYHGSFASYDSETHTRRDFRLLKSVAESEDIVQDTWGGRQHYLRWDPTSTWRNWESAGLDYDSTVGFADHIGFRCGTCYPFRTYDLVQRKTLRLIERPLLVMDGTLTSPDYMNLSDTSLLEHIGTISRVCRIFRGDLTILWHNSSLHTAGARQLFRDALHIAEGR